MEYGQSRQHRKAVREIESDRKRMEFDRTTMTWEEAKKDAPPQTDPTEAEYWALRAYHWSQDILEVREWNRILVFLNAALLVFLGLRWFGIL